MTKEISRTNKLYSAALLAEPGAAVQSITRALGIGELADALAADHMVDCRTWSSLDTTGRMFALATWLRAECAAIADLNARSFVTVEDPLHTVGTRD